MDLCSHFSALSIENAMNENQDSLFEPPHPKPLSKKDKPPFLSLLKKSKRSALDIYYEGHYKRDHLSYSMAGLKVHTPNHPSLVKEVLKVRYKEFPKHKFLAKMLHPLIGKGIFTTNGKTWERDRRIVDIGFEKAGLKKVYPLMVDAVIDMHKRLDAIPTGSIVDIDQEMTQVTADIIMRTILSTPITTEKAAEIFEYFEDFQESANKLNVLRAFYLPVWLSPKHFYLWHKTGKQIRHFLGDIINRRYAEFQNLNGETSYGDILEALMAAEDPETGYRFNRKDLLNQVVTLFLAGHETTASTLGWSLYILANQPKYASELHKEAETIYGSTPLPTFRELNKLKKTRDIFKEVLRLYPPIPIFTRENPESCPLGEHQVEAHSTINVCPWLIHRHENTWQNPHAFYPERFSNGESKKNNGSYLPFNIGPRVCAGAGFALQEAHLILSSIVKKYKLSPAEGHTPSPVARLTLRSENGVKIRMHRRPSPDTQEALSPSKCPYSSE